MKKFLLLISLCLTINFVLAAANNSADVPPKCIKDNFIFDHQWLILNNKKVKVPQIYLLHNISDKNFSLNHSGGHTGASAGWASTLHPNQWSALLLNKESFILTCSEMTPGSTQKLPCNTLLKVCELEEAKINSNLEGTFWLAEDKPLPDLLKAIEKRGIELS